MVRDMLDQILAGSRPSTCNVSADGTHVPNTEANQPSTPVEAGDSSGFGKLIDLDLRPNERLIDRTRMHPNNRDLPWIIELEAMEAELMEVLAELQPHLREHLSNDLETQT